MAGHIRRMAGGGKAREYSQAARRLIETLSRPDALQDILPASRHGENLLEMRRKTYDTGNEYMYLYDPLENGSFLITSNDFDRVRFPDSIREKLPGSVSIHTHPAGSPQPSYPDMYMAYSALGGQGKHDMMSFGMPEGARLGDSEIRMAPSLYGLTRIHPTKPSADRPRMMKDYMEGVQQAQDIWNDPRQMRRLNIDMGGSDDLTEETVRKMPFLRYLQQNPDAASGYWRDNADIRKDGVTLPSVIDQYLYGRGKYWKKGGPVRHPFFQRMIDHDVPESVNVLEYHKILENVLNDQYEAPHIIPKWMGQDMGSTDPLNDEINDGQWNEKVNSIDIGDLMKRRRGGHLRSSRNHVSMTGVDEIEHLKR